MKTCYDCFALHKYNLNTYIMPHAVIKSRHTNVKNHSEISRYFSVHVLPCSLRNSKELAKFYHFKLPWRLPGQLRHFRISPMEQLHLFMPEHEKRKPWQVIIPSKKQFTNNIYKMLIIIISLRWKHFVIISYLYKTPTIKEPYNQRKRDIRQTHTGNLTA